MEARPFVDGLLAEFGQRLELGPLALSKDGTCGFTFRNDVPIALELEEGGEVLHLHATMCSPIPEAGREALYERVLKLNLLGLETRGAVFAVSDHRNAIILCYPQPVEALDLLLLEAVFENFLAVVDRWHGPLNEAQSEPKPLQTEPDDDPRRFFLRV